MIAIRSDVFAFPT